MAGARSRTARTLLALALLVPLVLALWWFGRKPYSRAPAPYDVALDRALEPVLELHAASVKLHMSSPTQVKMLARQLAQDSAPYLAAADLELWAAIRLEAARSSPATCARLWQGGDETLLRQTIVRLGDARLRDWAEMLARGFALRLERKQPLDVSPSAVPRAMDAIVAGLPEDQQAAFRDDMSRRGLPDERACQLFLEVSSRSQQLEPELRIELYRALAAQLKASPPPAESPAER